MKQFTVPEMTF